MYTDAWCTGDGFKPYSTGFSGVAYDYPEKQCCSCGGGKAKDGQFYEPPYSKNADSDDNEGEQDQASSVSETCMDTPNWKNQYGLDCVSYLKKGYCEKGSVVKGKEWTSGAAYSYPETNCCQCGGGKDDPHM